MLEFVCCPFTTKIWLEVLLTDCRTTFNFRVIRINFFVLKSYTLWQCLTSMMVTFCFKAFYSSLHNDLILSMAWDILNATHYQLILMVFFIFFFQSEIIHEAEVMMKLDHQNIVRIIGKYRVIEGHFYFQSVEGLMLETHQFQKLLLIRNKIIYKY